jgi:hypothetical protein
MEEYNNKFSMNRKYSIKILSTLSSNMLVSSFFSFCSSPRSVLVSVFLYEEGKRERERKKEGRTKEES